MNSVPAGWYPNPEDATQVRYWDGAQWTLSTAPAMAASPEPPTVSQFTPPPAPTSAAPSPYVAGSAGATAAPTGTTSKKWLIGGAIVAGVIVVGSIGSAFGGAGGDTSPAETPAPIVAEPEPSPEEVAAETAPVPVPEETAPITEAADPVAFKAQAGSHLDDMLKDLDDIVTTVADDGFWRLLSNSGELAFNLGQLEALDVPENLVTAWPESLVALDGAMETLTDAITTQDGPSILAAVDTVRAQVESSRVVVESAQ